MAFSDKHELAGCPGLWFCIFSYSYPEHCHGTYRSFEVNR